MSRPAGRPLLYQAPQSFSIHLEGHLEDMHQIAADPSRPIQQRLDAFEDLFESEVGDTLFVRARNVERDSGLRQLWVKFEGDNPSGTQKDRIAFAQVLDALRRGFDALTLATCGNYGAATAFATWLAGLRCVVVVPEDYHTRRTEDMERLGATLRRVPGDYEAAVEHSRALAEADELYDANPGGANDLLQMNAYREIAFEIYDQLRDAPAAVAVPVSNGTTLAGIHRGFASLYRRGKTSRIPEMVAGSAAHKNPIVAAWRQGLDTCADLDPASIHETATNEPLINWHSLDGDQALHALRSTGGWAGDVGDRRLQQMARSLRTQQGLDVLPAATAGLLALLDHHANEPLPGDRYVAVLTGRNA